MHRQQDNQPRQSSNSVKTQQQPHQQQITNRLMLRCAALLVALSLMLSGCEAKSTADWVQSEGDSIARRTTTNRPLPTISIDNSAEEVDVICYSCHELIEEAKEMMKKQKAFLNRQRQKAKASQKSSTDVVTKFNNNSNNNNRQVTRDQNTTTPSTRTLNDAESRYTIVSRLRVARSAASDDETCKALNGVEDCLKELQDKCIGDLQFHSLEAVSKKWLQRYNCLDRMNPSRKKPWTGLTRIISERLPEKEIARPITSLRPDVGVMLKPTLTQSALHRFNTIQSSSGQQQPAQHPAIHKHQFMKLASKLMLIPCFLVAAIIVITIAKFFTPFRKNRSIDRLSAQ